jgi:gliding motility-associated-like protein
MRFKLNNIFAVFFSLCTYNSFSQTDCKYPVPPILTSVSIQPETSIIELNWASSPSPDIISYLVHVYHDENGIPRGDIVDTVSYDATSYTYVSTVTKYFSLSYVISALGKPDCESPFSNILNTIFCSSEIDTCKKEILIKWNSYPDYPKQVVEYHILSYKNGDPEPSVYRVGRNANNFILSDFVTDTRYCFVVKAVLEGGLSSHSNRSCMTTEMQRPPQWINADYATITDDKEISLSFSIDPYSEIKRFRLESKQGETGSFQIISELPINNNQIKYTDSEADINNINYYRLSAINNCNNPVSISNIASNIVLSLGRTENDINLTWNSYKNWQGTLSAYKLFINSGNGYREMRLLRSSDTTFSVAYSSIMYEVAGSEVCFHITAIEADNPHGNDGESRSSEECTSITENITVPNVFTPDGDLVNDLFRPVLSFTPVNYHMLISRKDGKVIYETKNEASEWDGTIKGYSLPQGVYLWFLKVTTPSGEIVSKTGTITIVRNR